MKHVLMTKGWDLYEIRRKFGHDLIKLWDCDEMHGFKESANLAAADAWNAARESNRFEDDFSNEPNELLDEYVRALSRLHTAETNFTLRYVTEPGEVVPNPLLLLDTFEPLKDKPARSHAERKDTLMPDFPTCHTIHRHCDRSGAAERVTLTCDERSLRPERLTTGNGEAFLIDLAHKGSLNHGVARKLMGDRLIAVVAAGEDLPEVAGDDLVRLAWHIGNRCTPWQIGPPAC